MIGIRRFSYRLGGAIVTLLLASIAVFAILRLLPADPARLILGDLASPEALAAQRSAMGLDKPVIQQYVDYITDFMRGDWGFDYGTGTPVFEELTTKLPATLELAFYAMMFAIIGAVILAVVSALSSKADTASRVVAYFGSGSAPFWVGLLVMLVFSEQLGYFPGPEGRIGISAVPPTAITHFYTFDALVTGNWPMLWDAIRHLVLPALVLGLGPLSYLYRLLRQSLQEVLDQEYLSVARAKGFTRGVAIVRHGVPNAILPALTAAGLLTAQLVAGSVLVEAVFRWPGVGKLVVDSVQNSDYAVAQAFVILSAVAFVVVNFVVDSLYGVIDPRLRRPAEG